jgi:hypothetical protein
VDDRRLSQIRRRVGSPSDEVCVEPGPARRHEIVVFRSYEVFPLPSSESYGKTAKGSEKRMQLQKTVIALLALLLAAMAMIPMVSADEQSLNEQNVTKDSEFTLPPEHHIPPEYFKDSKPATPLPESEMINIILSVKTLYNFDQEKQPGIINIPISYLNFDSQFTESKDYQRRHNRSPVIVLQQILSKSRRSRFQHSI